MTIKQLEELTDKILYPDSLVAFRLDGHAFSKLTAKLQKPFDERFIDAMSQTTQSLMTEFGVKFIYGYHQSDEISLLLPKNENAFNRRLSKFCSLMAGFASVKFTSFFGQEAYFDCRAIQLVNSSQVFEYFDERMLDCVRNSVNTYAYWLTVQSGLSKKKAHSKLQNLNHKQLQEYMFSEFGFNWNDAVPYHKRGIAYYFEKRMKQGYNPMLNEPVTVYRRSLVKETNIPKEYRNFLWDKVFTLESAE